MSRKVSPRTGAPTARFLERAQAHFTICRQYSIEKPSRASSGRERPDYPAISAEYCLLTILRPEFKKT